MSVTGRQERDPSVGDDGSSPRVRSRGLATLLGVVVTPLFLYIMVMATGGGHGTNYAYYYLAKMFFPWTMMSTAVTEYLTPLVFLLGVVQYPIYGIILDWARASDRFWPAVRALVAVHFVAIILAGAFSSRSFMP